jgi:PAS domain S-box-containing protein
MTKCARILVVDDDPQMLGITSRVLQRAGYTVIEATTGSDGLRLAKEQKPDLILLEVVLPDLDGLEVCRRVKADPVLANRLVVLISGRRTTTESQAEGLESGADGYISRPISDRELLARVEALVRIREAEQQLQVQTHVLRERVKELDCLYSISALVERPGISLEEILQGTADLILPAWQYPEVTAARITLDGRTFSTEGFREATSWRQAADIIVRGERRGAVEVFYLAERPPDDEGPFLKEERRLLNAIAERLGRITQRIWAEAALRESEERFRQLAENMQDAFWLRTPKTGDQREVLYANPAFEKIFGIPVEAVYESDSAWLEMVYEEDRDRTLTTLEEFLRGRGAYNVEYRIVRPDGAMRWIWARGVPIRDALGEVHRTAGIAQDVTERKQAEELLEAQNQFIVNVFESLTHPFYVVDANDYTIKMANSAAYQGELPQAATCYALMHGRSVPCGQDVQLCPLEEIKKTRRPAVAEHVHYDRHGQRRIYEVRGHPIFDAASQIVQVIEYSLDITERKQAAEALGQTTQLLESILEHTPALMAYLDPQFNFIRVNRAYAEADEREPAFFPGKNHFDLFPDPENEAIFRRVVETAQPYFVYAKPFEYPEHPERGVSYWDWSLIPIQDASGAVTGLILTLADVTERVRAELELERERDFSAAVLDTAGALVLVLDPQGRIVRFNRACEKLTGYTFDEVEGQPFWELFLIPEETEPVKAVFEQLQAGQFPNAYENHWLTRDGGRRLIAWSNTALLGKAGGAEYIIATGIDITERKRAEEALWESRERFRLAFDSANIGQCLVHPDGRLLRVNRAMCAMFGYSKDELESMTIDDITHPDYLNVSPTFIQQATSGQVTHSEFEKQYIHKEGRIVWGRVSSALVRNPAGTPRYFISLVQDVTERKQAEAALRESEKKYRQLIELAQEGVWGIDAEARTTFVNPRMAEMLGYTLEEMQGRHLFSFMDEQGVKIAQRNLERRQQGIRERHDFEFLRKDGARIYTSLETSPITDEDGTYVGALALVADITERRRAEEALSTLLEISRQVALTLQLEPLLYLVLDQLKTVVDYDDATIFKLEDETLNALAHRGTVPQEAITQQGFSLEQAPFGRQLIFDQQTVIIPDVHGDTPLAQDFQRVAGARLETLYGQVRSWMGVPLSIKDQVMGLLTLKHSGPARYNSEQAGLVRAFASQAAVAIENHRLYEQAQALAALEERQRLARDLHDAVSQTLFSASLAAEVLPRLWERKPEEGQRCLEEIRHLTRGALVEMRTLLLELRPSGLLEVGLDDLLRQLAEATSSRARVPVDLTIDGECPVAPDVQVTLYRIAQEALNNVVKHAGASRAVVSLRCGAPPSPPPSSPPMGGIEGGRKGGIELCIEDDGCGFDPQAAPADRLGLRIMHERAAAIGADIRIESEIGHGTQLEVIWPGSS